MKDILFVPLAALVIAVVYFFTASYFDPPLIKHERVPTTQDPLGLGRDSQPSVFEDLTIDQKVRLIPRFIKGLTSENELARRWYYVGLYKMVGAQNGTWEQMEDYPKGPKAIQDQYQKWWDNMMKQRAAAIEKAKTKKS